MANPDTVRLVDAKPSATVRRDRQIVVPVQDGLRVVVFLKSQGESSFVGFAVDASGVELLKFDCSGVLANLHGHYHLGVTYDGHPAYSKRFEFPEGDPGRQIAFAVHFYRHHLAMVIGLHHAEAIRCMRLDAGLVADSCERIGEALTALLPSVTPDCFPSAPA